MKIQTILFSLLCLMAFATCSDDDTQDSADLKYDGQNFSAPLFTDSAIEAGCRFPSNLTSNFTGQNLTEVQFYIMQVPTTCELLIYDQGTSSTPGTLLYERDLSSSIQADGWQSHNLGTPIELTGEDLWINIKVSHTGSQQSIGCDQGPALQNGDWMRLDNGGWQTLRNYSNNEVNINWNIRGFVE